MHGRNLSGIVIRDYRQLDKPLLLYLARHRLTPHNLWRHFEVLPASTSVLELLLRIRSQRVLFESDALVHTRGAERKYRRQSIHLSSSCAEAEQEYTIRFDKSFDPRSIVYKARNGGVSLRRRKSAEPCVSVMLCACTTAISIRLSMQQAVIPTLSG